MIHDIDLLDARDVVEMLQRRAQYHATRAADIRDRLLYATELDDSEHSLVADLAGATSNEEHAATFRRQAEALQRLIDSVSNGSSSQRPGQPAMGAASTGPSSHLFSRERADHGVPPNAPTTPKRARAFSSSEDGVCPTAR
jgi:hypothetical protein